MAKEIEHDGSYTKEISIEFECITKGCDNEFSYHSDDWDIYETETCVCGAEYKVYGDIDNGTTRVESIKEALIDEVTGKWIVPTRPAPNQIDMFYNELHGNLKQRGVVSI